ncbi:MAG: hypothetical protein ACKO81_03145 [Planctomycetota bacterium]|jgi:hypothetical protein
MKWNIRPVENSNVFLLDSDRPLPWMFDERLLRRSPVAVCDLLHHTSPRWRTRFAMRVAKRNRGKMPYELGSPGRSYFQLLGDLASIEGVVEIRDINRYTLQVQHGYMFTELPLGRAVARAFARHLYADEPFLFGDDPAESPEGLRRDFSLQR